MGDLIKRQDVIDEISNQIDLCNNALDSLLLGGRDRYAIETERNTLLELKDEIKQMPSSGSKSMYGYKVKDLVLIAQILKKENLPPDRVAEALADIWRIVDVVRDEFEESLKNAFIQSNFKDMNLSEADLFEPMKKFND